CEAAGYGGEGFSPGPGQSQTAQSATVSANVQFQFAVTGASFIFVGSDSHVVSSNAYFASNGAGGFPQPTGGTFSASSSDGSDQVSASQSPPEVKFTTADQSKSSGDRKLTFTYAAGGQQTSQSMNVTARQFAYATNT